MTRSTYVLLVVAALLGGLYAYYFTDLINTPRIQIIKSDRLSRWGQPGEAYPVAFTLDGRYRLSWVKVVPASVLATNKNPRPLWHLVSKSNSVPVQGFFYGQRIRGMTPLVANTRAQPLQPGVAYKLLIKAGGAKGELDFQPKQVAVQ